MDTETTQGALLERLAAEDADREALVFPARGLRWTWSDLERRSMDLARGLVALGIEPGERVVVWSDNRPDWVALQFALARAGAVLVTANTALRRDEIGYVLAQSGAAAVVAAPGWEGQEYITALEELRAAGALPQLRHAIGLETGPAAGLPELDEVVQLGRNVPEEAVRERTRATEPEQATNIQYTSGTTGFPKGVVLSHRNIVGNARAVGRHLGMTSSDRLLVTVPLFHCFGCAVSVLGCATHAATMVLLQRFDPGQALEALETERCTLVHGVPTMFAAMLAHEDFAERQLASLRTGIMAGTSCPAPLMRRVIDEMGCAGMLVAYGLTEASPAVTMSAPTDPIEARCETVGRPIEGVRIRIVDPASGHELGPGQRGELWVRGPNVMQGYFENPEATAAALVDGWLRTGDLAVLGEDGRVRITGRIKDMIIRAGENVYPAEVEDALREHPGVRDAAVFGVPSERYGEEVAAALVLEPGARQEDLDLEAFLDARLAHYKRPVRVHVVGELPMTPSGKVQKFVLAERFGKAP